MKKIVMFAFVLIVSFCLGFKGVLADEVSFDGIIDADSLVIYAKNDTHPENKVTELAYGTRVKVLGTVNNAYAGKCSLYKISYEDSKIGYTCKTYVRNYYAEVLTNDVAGIETYNDYCSTLKNNGFNESYCPYLYYLHSKYPKWIFKADQLNISLEEAAEAEKSKSSLQTNNSNYWLYTNPQEANYYYVQASVVEAFLDPRNSLFENRIFQFFDIDDNSKEVNDDALHSLVKDGNLKQYIDIFKAAAEAENINVVQLMVRSYQEGNNKVGYSPSSGTYTTDKGNKYNGNSLDGYYNFYNINATGTYVFVNALAYAASFFDLENANYTTFQRPWDTPEKAIKGGAEFLNTKYIKKGQDTIYYQKFNVSSYHTNNLYANQYMTNMMAPASEGSLVYSAYKASNSLDKELIFTIPVYKNMDEVVVQPVNKNTNSKIKAIKIDGLVIDDFDSEVIEQSEIFINKEENSFLLEAEAEEKTTEITGTGTINFENGLANVVLKATAEDGSSREYKLVVKQIKSQPKVKIDDIVSKMNVKINSKIIYGISTGTTVQSLLNEAITAGGSATIVDANGTTKTTGNLATGDKITIKGDDNSLTYVIAIRGDANGDGGIDLKDFVLSQSHILKKMTLTDEKFMATDVNYDGVIDLKDFVLIQSHILKKLTL